MLQPGVRSRRLRWTSGCTRTRRSPRADERQRRGARSSALRLTTDPRRRPLCKRHRNREPSEREPEAPWRSLHEPILGERAEGITDVGFVCADSIGQLDERRSAAGTCDTEEGTKDVDLEAHEVSLRSALNTRPLKDVDFSELPVFAQVFLAFSAGERPLRRRSPHRSLTPLTAHRARERSVDASASCASRPCAGG